MFLLIDNYDSFTFILAQYVRELGHEVHVKRNDKITIQEIQDLGPSHIIISPGPCTPNEAGISLDVVSAFAGELPILGVCLGHQCIGQAMGAKIIRAERVMHGRTSKMFHDERGVFAGLQNPFVATRYHSLVIDPASNLGELEVTAKDLGRRDHGRAPPKIRPHPRPTGRGAVSSGIDQDRSGNDNAPKLHLPR